MLLHVPLLAIIATWQPPGDAFTGMDACFIIRDGASQTTLVEHDAEQCQKRLPPCSTFKIALVSIAFDRGIFGNPDTPIPWDGKKRWLDAWNRDQTPTSFIRNSVIWVSRRITHQVGQDALAGYLQAFNYGNQDMSLGLDDAWLGAGSLTISGREQAAWLSRLFAGKTPISKAALTHTRSSLRVPQWQGPGTLFGKTGTCCVDPGCESGPGRQLGWFVGAWENGNQQVSFALNTSDHSPRRGLAGPEARKLAMKLLAQWAQESEPRHVE